MPNKSNVQKLDEAAIAALNPTGKTPKILLFDIETAPSLGFYFDRYKEGNIVTTARDWYILCFAYKWLGEAKVHHSALIDHDYNPKKPDDWHVIKELWHVFNEADYIIAHNGDQFDVKKSNARFAIHGLPSPTPYISIDTKKMAKKYFSFESNKLDELGRQLNVGRKAKTGGFDLWIECMAGDKKAWAKMIEYNKQDVELLEQVYLKLRGWHSTHPNISFITRKHGVCPTCQSENIKKDGNRYTRTGSSIRYECKDCGRHFTGPTIHHDKIRSY